MDNEIKKIINTSIRREIRIFEKRILELKTERAKDTNRLAIKYLESTIL